VAETQRVAVFVDLENVPASFIEPAADLGDSCGRVCHLAVYADWRHSANRAAWGTTLDLGGVPKQIMKAGGANSADISMVVDAMELLLLAPDIDVFVLASGDSDFVPLIQKLRARAKLVVGAAPAGRTIRPEYESAFDRFERLHEPSDDSTATSPKAARPSPPSASAANAGASLLSLDTTRKALVGILSREGPMTAGELGQQLRDAVPGFDQRTLGFRRLSDLLRAQADLIAVHGDGMALRVMLLGAPGVASSSAGPGPANATTVAPALERLVVDAARGQASTAPESSIARTDWTRLRDHLLAVLLAPRARPSRSDDELRSAMDALAKKTSDKELPAARVADIAGRYPACFGREADGTIAPAVGLADAYKLRLGRVWEPLPRHTMRKGLALLPAIVGGEPVVLVDVANRLAEAANGELTQADARTLVNLVRKAEGWVTEPPDATGKTRVRAKGWVIDPAEAEARLDEAALARMGPFLPVDRDAMAAALGIEEGKAE
jgi:hypothetical protein